MTLPPQLQTSPSPSATPQTSAAPARSPSTVFPLTWLLDHASAPIQFRAITEVARLDSRVTEHVALLPFTHRPALALSVHQRADGTWGRAMLAVPVSRGNAASDVGTISAARRLLECGWNRETPPLLRARRLLFRLLAEDDDPAFLFEFANEKGGMDDALVHRGRRILREAAAATLAQAGYEDDPRLRGAARRILARTISYLCSPVAHEPFIRRGNQCVLAAEAAPPSIHCLLMLAYMPAFRHEHHNEMAIVYRAVSSTLPRHESMQLVGSRVVAQPHLVLGDPLPNWKAAHEDVAFAVTWLELMARLGFLKLHEDWTRLFDRFLEGCDDRGVWRPSKGTSVARSRNPIVWPALPLEEHLAGEARWTDVTFRLGLIARLMGRDVDIE